MGDVDGGLLKCVLQLAACSDKLRASDAALGRQVKEMQGLVSGSDLPALKAQLAVVAADSDAAVAAPASPASQIRELVDLGNEASERLEVTKAQLERELRRRSDEFRALVSSRNADIQGEYARMLKELDDQVVALSKELEDERGRRKRRRLEAKARRESATLSTQRRLDLARENEQLKHEIESHSASILRLQDEFAALEQQSEAPEDDDMQGEGKSSEHVDGDLAALRREVEMLRDARDAIAVNSSGSFKDQYSSELAELKEELAHLKRTDEEMQAQLSSQSVRLHALLRIFAPNASIGTLMTRLHQQLASESDGPRKTVELQAFLQSCPSAEEGKRAIEELKKLQLIYCYESSGVITLVD
ncbi:hypothetical protein ATCC90586_004384 [Pythium insidiosum]|nr:hypothetical protein ATCC90586_004384 [Pythium insidiosum]